MKTKTNLENYFVRRGIYSKNYDQKEAEIEDGCRRENIMPLMNDYKIGYRGGKDMLEDLGIDWHTLMDMKIIMHGILKNLGFEGKETVSNRLALNFAIQTKASNDAFEMTAEQLKESITNKINEIKRPSNVKYFQTYLLESDEEISLKIIEANKKISELSKNKDIAKEDLEHSEEIKGYKYVEFMCIALLIELELYATRRYESILATEE